MDSQMHVLFRWSMSASPQWDSTGNSSGEACDVWFLHTVESEIRKSDLAKGNSSKRAHYRVSEFRLFSASTGNSSAAKLFRFPLESVRFLPSTDIVASPGKERVAAVRNIPPLGVCSRNGLVSTS